MASARPSNRKGSGPTSCTTAWSTPHSWRRRSRPTTASFAAKSARFSPWRCANISRTAACLRVTLLQGRTWDLIQNQTLDFLEIREGEAVYYIADFKFINEEWRFFEVDFRPEGAEQTYTFEFKHQLYVDQ